MDAIFSGGFSLERVNPVGLVLMAAAVIIIAAGRPIAKRRTADTEKQTMISNGIKLAGLVLCCIGAGIAILLG